MGSRLADFTLTRECAAELFGEGSFDKGLFLDCRLMVCFLETREMLFCANHEAARARRWSSSRVSVDRSGFRVVMFDMIRLQRII